MHRRDFVRSAAIFAAGSMGGLSRASAQSSYPSSPVRLVVPFPPGGVVDVLARQWAERVGPSFGRVYVENNGGAGGTVGASRVARAEPDGLTLLFGETSCLVIAPPLMAKPPYDPEKDLAPISLVATSSTSIVVHPSVPAKTLAEFIAYAKANPGKLSYGTSGVGTVTHLAGELFKQLAGVDMLHVPYRGIGPATTDTMAGTIPVMTPNITTALLSMHETGTLRILAICSPNRFRSAPDIPTAAETLPGMVMQLTAGIAAPTATPPAIVAKVAEASERVGKDAEFLKSLEVAGAESRSEASPENARAFWSAERSRLLPIIRTAGLQPQ